MVCRRFIITDIDCPYDTNKKDPVYTKPGNLARYGINTISYGDRNYNTFHFFREVYRTDGSPFGLFPLAARHFAFLLYLDTTGKKLVYQEVCTLAIVFGLFIPQINYGSNH